ncbi:MAG: GDP-L-fucose synthase [Candidatus Omnitrophica bacterium]|nr:GDP-L-fucose synthase [Candidatus Omnitrophota bacterium]MBU2251381.1 GDP-L-fucose synthase [Candidatus Omnitrophota bacterium]
MEKQARIYVAGHTGLVGKSLVRELNKKGYTNLLTRSHQELDLTRQIEVERFFSQERPDYVFLAAARVGGIGANSSYPADFIYENLMIQTNTIHSAYASGVKKLLFFGSACMYPKHCLQPMNEDNLLTGRLESTSEPYAIAKIAGVKMCEAYNRQYKTSFICIIPSNIYGPDDHFGSQDSHVLPALIDKFHQAKINNFDSVIVWGSGNPRREFVFIDDVAKAAIFLITSYNGSTAINLGSGENISIKELAMVIKDIVGYKGELIFDNTKPDGAPEKSLDATKIRKLGWLPKTSLEEGIAKTYLGYQTAVKLSNNEAETGVKKI